MAGFDVAAHFKVVSSRHFRLIRWILLFVSKRLIIPISLVLLVVGLATLLAIVGMTAWLDNRATEHFDEVVKLRNIRLAAVELRSSVQSAESSERGFLLTSNKIYLSRQSPRDRDPQRTARTARPSI